MAFVLELQTDFTQPYIKNYVISIIREFKIKAIVKTQATRIVFAFDSQAARLHECLEVIAAKLPASCFLKASTHYEAEGEPDALPELDISYPLGLGLCPACYQEMFDPSTRRYYYPFSSCSHCGGNYAFFTEFPYERKNTSFRFFTPCKDCEAEMQTPGIKENHYINSCHQCGVPVRLKDKKNERYANDAGSFRTMFEVAAKALKDDKTVLIKTTFGYRKFYNLAHRHAGSTLMFTDANQVANVASLGQKEFNSLLSIERPILHVRLSEELQKQLSSTWDVKYPDEGFSILLTTELQKLGESYILYEDTVDAVQADLVMDYDLEVGHQKDMKLFVNKDVTFIGEGERVCFPSKLSPATHTLSVAHGFVGVRQGENMLFDKMEHFESVHVEKAVLLEGEEDEKYHSNQHMVSQDECSFMSVIAENMLFGQKCVGVHFDEAITFLYFDGKSVIRVIPPKQFESQDLIEKIAELREGSKRLVENLQAKLPELYGVLESIAQNEAITLFEAAGMILELEEATYTGVVKEALKYGGKGGVQIDMKITDNRLDKTAFLASLISYRLAGTDSVMLAYSILESLGDYFNDVLGEIKTKTKSDRILLCGSSFANSPLFSRMQRNLKLTPPIMNKNFPIGKENAVVGGVYL